MYRSFKTKKEYLDKIIKEFCALIKIEPADLLRLHKLPDNTLERTLNDGHMYGHLGLFDILVNRYGMNPAVLFDAAAPLTQVAINNRDVTQAQNSHNTYANCSGCSVIKTNIELVDRNNVLMDKNAGLHEQLLEVSKQAHQAQIVSISSQKKAS